MIEKKYHHFLEEMIEMYGGEIRPTLKGEHVQRNTWLCASAHFWKEICSILMLDSEEERDKRAQDIREEIDNSEKSNLLKQFHQTCFPNIPIQLIAVIWMCAGRAMIQIGVPIVSLPPGKEREARSRAVDNELLKLKTLWMSPPSDQSSN